MENLEGKGETDETLGEIQKLLYSTEVRPQFVISPRFADFPFSQDGFEVPEGGAGLDEEETF